MASEGDIDRYVRVFVKIRDEKAQVAREAKEKEAVLTEELDKIRRALLDYCKENGVEKVGTASGTFFRSVKTRYSTSDWESMHKFILKHELPDLLDKRINQGNMRQFLEENPEQLPPGLNVDREYAVTVRRK
tara:strand:+ start:1065 stop:1460 length:396 start_codon:yes stop_codon:yes gene_type:complete